VLTRATDQTSSGYRYVARGTCYVKLVGFDNAGPVAKGVLTYGQSVDPL
jgi:acyl-homoserine-lactone acylase